MSKILLSAYTGLGNMVLKTPMMRQMAGLLPDVSLDLVAESDYGFGRLFNESGIVRKLHFLPQRASLAQKAAFFRALRGERYDAVLLPFDAQPNFLLLGSYLAGIRLRIVHADVAQNRSVGLGRWLKGAKLPRTIRVPVPPGRHEIDLNHDLLEVLCGRSFGRSYETAVGFEPKPDVLGRFRLKENGYVLLQPGAANGMYKSKVWSPANFAALTRRLLQHPQMPPVVLVGDRGDYGPSARPIVEALPASPELVDAVGKTSLNELLNLIAGAQLVVCHDSGVMHLTDALGKNLIALYGPTDYGRTRPLRPSSQLLFSKTRHFAVMRNFALTEADLKAQGVGHEAMDGIGVDQLEAAIVAALGLG